MGTDESTPLQIYLGFFFWRFINIFVMQKKMENQHIRRVMRKSTFCNALSTHLTIFFFFCYIIEPSLISKSEISSLNQSSVVVKVGLYRNRSEAPKAGLFTTRLIFRCKYIAML